MDKFCTACGTEHVDETFPKVCTNCKHITFKNPVPVAVALIPVETLDNETGILIAKRGIAPHVGEWALPGGFMELTDATIEHAAAREVEEELGLKLNPNRFNPVGSFCNGKNVLIFCEYDIALDYEDIVGLKITEETLDYKITFGDDPICFSSHQRQIECWIGRFYG